VQDAAAVKSAVAAAAGIDPARGDTITQASVAFPKVEEPKTGPIPTGMVGYAKGGALGLAGLLFLFAGWRALRKREKEALAEPSWLTEIDTPMSLSELEAGSRTRELAPVPVRAKDPAMSQLEGLVDQEPERVAAQVRQWMDER
jgi:flagellar M-ring protein FliF